MKSKFFLGLMLMFSLALSSFKAEAQRLVWPQGKAEFIDATVDGVTAEATVGNRFTYIKLEMDTAMTLNLDLAGKMPEGSLLFIEASSDATARTLTAGDKLQFPAITGVISKGKLLGLVWVPSRNKFVIFSERQFN